MPPALTRSLESLGLDCKQLVKANLHLDSTVYTKHLKASEHMTACALVLLLLEKLQLPPDCALHHGVYTSDGVRIPHSSLLLPFLEDSDASGKVCEVNICAVCDSSTAPFRLHVAGKEQTVHIGAATTTAELIAMCVTRLRLPNRVDAYRVRKTSGSREIMLAEDDLPLLEQMDEINGVPVDCTFSLVVCPQRDEDTVGKECAREERASSEEQASMVEGEAAAYGNKYETAANGNKYEAAAHGSKYETTTHGNKDETAPCSKVPTSSGCCVCSKQGRTDSPVSRAEVGFISMTFGMRYCDRCALKAIKERSLAKGEPLRTRPLRFFKTFPEITLVRDRAEQVFRS